MRIAIVRTPGAPAGCGAALTASALAAAGHRVRIVTDAPGDPELVAPREGPGALRVEDPAGDRADDMAAAWADEPPEVVHAIGPVAGRAAAATGLPVVVACPVDDTGMPAGGPPPDTARILASSEDQHALLLRAGVPRARLRIVPAGVDTGTFTPDGPALARRPHPRLVTVGSLATGSGADAAIRGLARVPAAELLVGGGAAGDDPDRARLFAIAREVGVAGRVRFLGPVDHAALPRLLRSADVVVAAPEHDVPAGPVLQAMACARPVVATAVGGLRDAVVDRVTGVHVRPGHPDELAAGLREVLADDALRIGYGVAGRDRAVSRFDGARIADALTRIYAEVIGAADGEPGDREPVGATG